MDEVELQRRFASSPVARLATVRRDGAPHIVPVAFALSGDLIYSAVDAKPKRSTVLQRLTNVRAEPRCALLVDHYDNEDWSALWWVRADGHARVIDDPAVDHEGLLALVRRYTQYRSKPPTGPLLAVMVTRWSGWSSQ